MHDIFKHFIQRAPSEKAKRTAYLMWFVDQFPLMEFTGEDYYFQCYAKFSADLEVPFKINYLEVFISTELKRLMVSSRVKIPGTEEYNFDELTALETAFLIMSDVMKADFQMLEAMESEIDDFKVEIVSFCKDKLRDRYISVLSKHFEMAQKKHDSFDAIDDSIDDLMLLKEIYNLDAINEMVDEVDGEVSQAEMQFVVNSGLPGLDKYMTGLYGSQLLTLAGPTGYGKTRMAVGIWCYRAAVEFKRNVAYYVLEQKKSEIVNMLVAVHVFRLFGIIISDDMMNKHLVPEDLKDKVEAAKIDLFESGKWGKIFICETEMFSDTFIHKIKIHDRLKGPFDLIEIDYMSLIDPPEGKSHVGSDWQATRSAYRVFKRYLRRTNKAGIAVDQYNKEGDAVAKEDKDLLPSHWQHGMEALKSCDYSLGFSATTVMRSQNLLTLQNPKVRSTAPMPRMMLRTRLEISNFQQDVTNKL